MSDGEMRALREDARRAGMTVSQWVRDAIKDARRQSSASDPARKLAAIRAAADCDFPTSDIDQMLAEIEKGYLSG